MHGTNVLRLNHPETIPQVPGLQKRPFATKPVPDTRKKLGTSALKHRQAKKLPVAPQCGHHCQDSRARVKEEIAKLCRVPSGQESSPNRKWSLVARCPVFKPSSQWFVTILPSEYLFHGKEKLNTFLLDKL